MEVLFEKAHIIIKVLERARTHAEHFIVGFLYMLFQFRVIRARMNFDGYMCQFYMRQ